MNPAAPFFSKEIDEPYGSIEGNAQIQLDKAPFTHQARGRASDHDRDDVASEQKYLEKGSAAKGEHDYEKLKAGEEQDYFSAERAEFDANS